MDGLIALALAKKQVKALNDEIHQSAALDIPPAPTTDGTYRLVVTVNSGVTTYEWVSLNAAEGQSY